MPVCEGFLSGFFNNLVASCTMSTWYLNLLKVINQLIIFKVALSNHQPLMIWNFECLLNKLLCEILRKLL